MDLQHQQLKQLTDWLDLTEARIKRMEAEPLGPDLENVKHQVEEHKVCTFFFPVRTWPVWVILASDCQLPLALTAPPGRPGDGAGARQLAHPHGGGSGREQWRRRHRSLGGETAGEWAQRQCLISRSLKAVIKVCSAGL